MHHLFPSIKTFHQTLVSTSKVDKIYIEQCGEPNGLPILVLHNGPGSIGSPFYRRFFDPEKYRIIVMDQRGSGRSEPLGNLQNNNTNELIRDIITIREHLSIDKWLIFGYGLGATLGLLYAEQYPKEILGMLLIGTQLCRLQDLHWFYQDGANNIYPDHWEKFISHLKAQELSDTIHGYNNMLTGEDDLVKMSAAKSWQNWHTDCIALHIHKTTIDTTSKHHTYSKTMIQNHYLLNRFFIQENQILEEINKIQEIPAYLVHGRYDMISPMKSSWILNKSWNKSKLFIIREACHAVTEPSLIDAIIVASNLLYNEISNESINSES